MKKVASKYFGKGFDLCKKQIGRLHPELDIQDLQINTDLVKEEEENKGEEEMGEDGELDDNPPPNRLLNVFSSFLFL